MSVLPDFTEGFDTNAVFILLEEAPEGLQEVPELPVFLHISMA